MKGSPPLKDKSSVALGDGRLLANSIKMYIPGALSKITITGSILCVPFLIGRCEVETAAELP